MRPRPEDSLLKINIESQKDDSATRLEKLQKNYPEILGYGITEEGGTEKISVIVEKTTPELKSLFREGIRGHEISFIEVGKIEFTLDPTVEYRPICGGIQISTPNITGMGTLGVIAYRKGDNKPFILSNNHILAAMDNGDGTRAKIGDIIYQPANYPGLEVGKLYDYEPYWGTILMDAAIAELTVDAENFILDIPAISGTAQPSNGMSVSKSGIGTGYTTGSITSTKATLRMQIPNHYACVTLIDTILTTKMSGPGDSGSILMAGSNAVGLLFAGSDSVTFHNEIEHVLDRFDLYLKPYDGYTTPDLCEGVVCDDVCVGNDLHTYHCDPNSGWCTGGAVISDHEDCAVLPDPFVIGDIVKFSTGPGNWVHGRVVSIISDTHIMMDYGGGVSEIGTQYLTFVKHCSEATADDPVWWHCDGEQPPDPDPDPCEGVICDPECYGHDRHETVCQEGICIKGVLIEEDSSVCGYVPPDPDPNLCEGVICQFVCDGYDKWSQKCAVNDAGDAECIKDGLVETNSSFCGYAPPDKEMNGILWVAVIAIAFYLMFIKNIR